MRKICKMKTKSGANSSTTVTKVKVHLDDRNAGGADEASVTPVASTALTAPVVSSVCTETELLMNIAKHVSFITLVYEIVFTFSSLAATFVVC